LRFNSGFNSTAATTLRYVGSANATTDRNFTIAGNGPATTTNSVIESSGVGTLSFTNNANIAFAGTNPNRHLRLGGTNLGNNSFGLGLTDNGALASSLTKEGAGKWIITGTHTYTGATTVSAGTLLVNGSLGNTAVTVSAGAFGGTGTIGSTLNLTSGSFHVADLNDALAVSGTITLYAGFGIDDLAGIDWGTTGSGTYTLISGTLGAGVFDAMSHNSLAEAFDVGSGKKAYFQEGSLQLVVIPEPSAALLGGLGLVALLRRRRA
jgi:autotransporter-associated beta strand protein